MLFIVYLLVFLCYTSLEVMVVHPYFENNINQIYISYWKESYNYNSHFQNKIEVAYCFSGFQKVRIGESIYTLGKGDAAFISPNIVHEYIKCEAAPNVKTETISLMSETDFFASLLPELITKRPLSPFVPAGLIDKDTALAFRKMASTAGAIELLGWACIALSGITKNLELIPFKEAESFRLAPAIVSYINANFQKPLTIKSLASEFGYSASYIAHVFYDQLKIPFRTYLGSVRSEHAKDLILKSDKNLTEISYECGYNSLNTFCRCFKKRYGVTPSEVKKQR